MFSKFFRNKAEEALRAATATRQKGAQAPDSCKRAINLFPDLDNREPELKDTYRLRFHHLLVSLEGSERTGCLKISSHSSRSRSAILLYRGRVVGAVYGCKRMRGQYLHQDAHKCAMSDLAAPGNILDAYELPEDLVLAAASLFYGETLDTNTGYSSEATFDYAVNSLLRSGLPGTVVINTASEETLCVVYVARGRVIGFYSAADGWIKGSPDTAKRFLRSANCKVHASIMPNVEPQHVGFSLTGLGDKRSFDASPFQSSGLATAANLRTPTREAVAQAVREHRSTGQHQVLRPQTYAGV